MSELPGDPSPDIEASAKIPANCGFSVSCDLPTSCGLAQWDCGTALENNTNERVSASSARSVVCVDSADFTDFCAWRISHAGGVDCGPTT